MLFSQGGLFSLKCLYQINFDDNWFSKKPQHLNRATRFRVKCLIHILKRMTSQ